MTSVAAEARRPLWQLTAIRVRLGLVGLLVALAIAAWWWTAREMRGMDGGPWTSLGGLGWFVGVWVVMMAAMMFPSVAPTVALYSRMTQKRSPIPGFLFVGGYLIPWAIAGLAAYGVAAAGGSFAGGVLHWDRAGRWVAGVTLLAAAAYELTPLKDYCLGKCRSPLGQLLGSWRGGVRGAVSMGARNGAYCVGCCWALMAALFALGVMSLVWMAFVAALIAVEKLLPWRRVATFGITALLLALAILMFAAPHALPGLTIPTGGMSGTMTM
jgi:predicted metal-binding membrane protein